MKMYLNYLNFLKQLFQKIKLFYLKIKIKKELILSLKITIGFDEIESKLFLKETKFTYEELFKILFKEIKEIKIKGLSNTNNETKDDNNKNELINNLVKKNEEMESTVTIIMDKYKEQETKINLLIDENKKMKDILNKYQDFLEKRIEEEKKEKELKQKEKEEYDNFVKQNINTPFNKKPQYLKFRHFLTNNNCSSQWFSKIGVYTGLKDLVGYLVYDNKNNHNLDIMRIIDKTIITTVKGHNSLFLLLNIIRKTVMKNIYYLVMNLNY